MHFSPSTVTNFSSIVPPPPPSPQLLTKLSEMGSSVAQEEATADFKGQGKVSVAPAAEEDDIINSESEAEEEGSPLGKMEESQSAGQRCA